MKRIIVIFIIQFAIYQLFAEYPKPESGRIFYGESFRYKAKWGLLTIGSATTKSDKRLYKIGSHLCCKIQLSGTTNGVASLFYLNDYWVSYIDIHSFTTVKAYRMIQEGKYRLDEWTFFKPEQNKAEVWKMNYSSHKFTLSKNYKTPENIRDVVAGFMMIRWTNLSKLHWGDQFVIEGFYKDTGYSIAVKFSGTDTFTLSGKAVTCYKLKPLIPKNSTFSNISSADIWISAHKPFDIIKIKASTIVGEINIEQIQ